MYLYRICECTATIVFMTIIHISIKILCIYMHFIGMLTQVLY